MCSSIPVSYTHLDVYKRQILGNMGEAGYRAGQIFAWLYKGAESFEEMKNIPMPLRERIGEEYSTGALHPSLVQVSKIDGTRKYLFELEDGNAIESVFMKYKYGHTICISSQAGCRMGCRFCASTLDGLCRDLTPGEMSEQLLAVQRDTGERINHIVIMGSGEMCIRDRRTVQRHPRKSSEAGQGRQNVYNGQDDGRAKSSSS